MVQSTHEVPKRIFDSFGMGRLHAIARLSEIVARLYERSSFFNMVS
jgi:hypothetical protein